MFAAISTFASKVDGLVCDVAVTHYFPAVPMHYGRSWGDAIEGEPEEFEFILLDAHGERWEDLERDLTTEDNRRIRNEYMEVLRQEQYWDY